MELIILFCSGVLPYSHVSFLCEFLEECLPSLQFSVTELILAVSNLLLRINPRSFQHNFLINFFSADPIMQFLIAWTGLTPQNSSSQIVCIFTFFLLSLLNNMSPVSYFVEFISPKVLRLV